MADSDIYYTIEASSRAEIKIKGSRFIASASPAATKEDALLFLEHIRSEFYNATHNCFAYIIGWDELQFRSSDDGEPSGSAGKPILFTIKKFELTDIIVVVTRFFGGTKLGVGGLARAYSEAAEKVLLKCTKRTIYRTVPVQIFCTYEDVSAIQKLLQQYAISFTDEYTDSIKFTTEIPISKAEEFRIKVTSVTNGRAGCVFLA